MVSPCSTALPLIKVGWCSVCSVIYNTESDSVSVVLSIGKVQYQSRFLRSETYKKNMAANRIVVSEFGTAAHADPCKTLFQRSVS